MGHALSGLRRLIRPAVLLVAAAGLAGCVTADPGLQASVAAFPPPWQTEQSTDADGVRQYLFLCEVPRCPDNAMVALAYQELSKEQADQLAADLVLTDGFARHMTGGMSKRVENFRFGARRRVLAADKTRVELDFRTRVDGRPVYGTMALASAERAMWFVISFSEKKDLARANLERALTGDVTK
ncbi:hypothetical protein ACRC7T_13735 [Segnochrobactraceae bacterium EtOH-i3]